MDKDELQRTNPIYNEKISDWRIYRAMTEGINAIKDADLIKQHSKEDSEDYNSRLEETIGFLHSSSMVDLYSFFLISASRKDDLAQLDNDPKWDKFILNCDLWGTDFDDFMSDNQRFAEIYGYSGVLIDKPSGGNSKEIYPYLSRYTPENILDWKFERNELNQPFLSMIKLKDFENNYLIWTIEKWERYIIDEDSGEPVLVDSDNNPLGIIPFVWHISQRDSIYPYLGVSLIRNVALIDISIMRNLSQADRVLKMSAFPIYRAPLLSSDIESSDSSAEIAVGESNVAIYDPEYNAKPDWMKTEVEEPINSIFQAIERKIDEIYRSMNLGSMRAAQTSKDAWSAEALAQEFQLLNVFLVRQGKFLTEAKRRIIYFWLLWEKKESWFEKISFDTPLKYDIAALATELENLMTAKSMVASQKFGHEIDKKVVRNSLPELNIEIMKDIFDEIETGVNPTNYEDVMSAEGEKPSEKKGL